jgi:hypothetical protein
VSGLVSCSTHGDQQPAYVCCHLAATLSDNRARGVVSSIDEDGAVNAYCDACADLLDASGGEWTEDLEKKAEIKLVCRGCFDQILVINENVGLN